MRLHTNFYGAAVETNELSNYFPVTKGQADLIPIHASVRIGTTKTGSAHYHQHDYNGNIYEGFVTKKINVTDDDGNILYVKLYTDAKETSWKCTRDFANATATGSKTAFILHICFGISGETDFVKGKHDGYIGESNAEYRMYRVMGTEYNPGLQIFALDLFSYISKENVTATKYIPYSYTASGKQDERIETFDIKINDFVLQSAMIGVEINNKGLGYNNIGITQRATNYGGLKIIDLIIDPATGAFLPITLDSKNNGFKLTFAENTTTNNCGCSYGPGYDQAQYNMLYSYNYSFGYFSRGYRD